MIKTNSNMSQKSNSRSTTLLGAGTLRGFRERSSVSFNPKSSTTMRKVTAFSVTRMSELSREQMALVQGGAINEFLTGECTSANEGQKCYISVPGGVVTGKCGYYTVTYSSPSQYSSTTYYTCIKD